MYRKSATVDHDIFKSAAYDPAKKLKAIRDYIQQSNYFEGLYIKDLKTNEVYHYNKDKYVYAASISKYPYAYYALTELEKNPSKYMQDYAYTMNSFIGGSGAIQRSKLGTKFSSRELFKRCMIESDNIAYIMLQDIYGIDGYNKFQRDNNFKVSISRGISAFGDASAAQVGDSYERVYDKIKYKDQYWRDFIEFSSNMEYSPTKPIYGSNFLFSEKNGHYGSHYHYGGLAITENPFVAVFITRCGHLSQNERVNVFTKAIELTKDFIDSKHKSEK